MGLSFPEGGSVNDGINSEICSLNYAKVEDVAAELVKQGHGARMAKLDIRSAYKTMSVHPQDGGCWVCNGKVPCLWT